MPSLPSPTAITDLDGVALSQAIHARDVSCAEVLQAYLARIDALNPQVNAIVAMQDPALLQQRRRRARMRPTPRAFPPRPEA